MQGNLNFIVRNVQNVASERAFYLEALGMRLEGESPTFVQFHQSQAAEGVMFALNQWEEGLEALELWWQIADADAVHAELLARGTTIVSAPEDRPFGRTLVVQDAEGHNVYLYAPHSK